MGELQVADIRAQVALTLFDDFDGDRLAPGPHQAGILTTMLDQTVAWSRALATVRHEKQSTPSRP